MHATRDPALTPGSDCPQPPALTRSTPQYHATRYPCVSLQVGQDRAQLAGTPVLDVLPAKPDWAEAAAVVGALRCGVAVDTGVLPARSVPTFTWRCTWNRPHIGRLAALIVRVPAYPRFYQGRRWAPVVARIALRWVESPPFTKENVPWPG
jgi:hypothetical protein